MSFRRIAGFAGIAFVVLLVANGILSGDQPAPGDPLQDVVEYYQDDPGLLELGLGASTLATLFFPVFLVGVVGLLGGRDEPWAVVGLVGGIMLATLASVNEAFAGVLILRQEFLDADGLLLVLWDLNNLTFALLALAGAVAIGGLSLAAHRSSALPSWMAWLGGLSALCGAVSAVSTVDFASGNAVAFVGVGFFVLFLVWVLVASLVMARADAAAPATPQA